MLDECLVLPLIVAAQLALLVLEHDELLKLYVRRAVLHLTVQCQEGHAGVEGFTRLGRQTHDLKPSHVDLLGELVDGDVRWSAHKDLAGVHFGEVIDDGGRGDGLSGAGRALNEGEGLLQDVLDRIHLGVVKLGEARRGEALGHGGAQALRLELMAEQLVVLRKC